MNFYARRFNVYLMLLMMLALASTSCAMFHKKKKGPEGAVRVHVESASSADANSQPVSVLRADPVMVTITKDAILTEADLLKAVLVLNVGGPDIGTIFQCLWGQASGDFWSMGRKIKRRSLVGGANYLRAQCQRKTFIHTGHEPRRSATMGGRIK